MKKKYYQKIVTSCKSENFCFCPNFSDAWGDFAFWHAKMNFQTIYVRSLKPFKEILLGCWDMAICRSQNIAPSQNEVSYYLNAVYSLLKGLIRKSNNHLARECGMYRKKIHRNFGKKKKVRSRIQTHSLQIPWSLWYSLE